MAVNIHQFLCLSDNFGVLLHDPATKATAAVDVPEAARALAQEAPLLLADEPTGNLDWDMSMRLLQLLIELNRSGKAVLFATHDMNLIRAAKQRGIKTIVSHIEDANLMARMWQMGVDYIQGYYIQEPDVVLLATDAVRR